MAIKKGYKRNFQTVLTAASTAHLGIVECTDKATKKPVIVICAFGRQGTEITMTPLAKLFDGNPYKELDPLT